MFPENGGSKVVHLIKRIAYSCVVHINLMLRRLITFYKGGILLKYVMIIFHALCSSGVFYIVNLYY